MGKRVVDVGVLPGEAIDGAGRVCIHLFVPDTRGPFVEPHALHPVIKDSMIVKQQVEAKPTRGRLACSPVRTVAPVTRGGATRITLRSDDPRAVTCPRCIASTYYADAMELITTAAEAAR